MRLIELEECCLRLTDAEDKLPGLRVRRVKGLVKWLRSLTVDYMDAEGISESEVEEMIQFLELERWLRE